MKIKLYTMHVSWYKSSQVTLLAILILHEFLQTLFKSFKLILQYYYKGYIND